MAYNLKNTLIGREHIEVTKIEQFEALNCGP